MRKPAVAHRFYEGNYERLKKQVSDFMLPEDEKVHCIAAIAPHAGFMYSGQVAGAVYSKIAPPEVFIIIGPNHSGFGPTVSVMTSGSWQMPWGESRISEEIARKLKENSRLCKEDERAHRYEHSLEVQLPFIHTIAPEAQFIPLTMKRMSYSDCQELAEDIHKTILSSEKKVLLVASTDMSHFEPHDITKDKDQSAIEHIIALDAESLYNYVTNFNISMCGMVPTVVTIIVSKLRGAKQCQLIHYMTSGEISGDYASVVGYAGFIIQ